MKKLAKPKQREFIKSKNYCLINIEYTQCCYFAAKIKITDTIKVFSIKITLNNVSINLLHNY